MIETILRDEMPPFKLAGSDKLFLADGTIDLPRVAIRDSGVTLGRSDYTDDALDGLSCRLTEPWCDEWNPIARVYRWRSSVRAEYMEERNIPARNEPLVIELVKETSEPKESVLLVKRAEQRPHSVIFPSDMYNTVIGELHRTLTFWKEQEKHVPSVTRAELASMQPVAP